MAYPKVNTTLFKGASWISQYPDYRAVKDPADKYPLRPAPWPAASADHMGIDLFGVGSAPAVSVPKTADGVVVEANHGKQDGKYGWWNTSGYYVAVRVHGTIGCEVVWTVKHLASISVKVGDQVKVGQKVGVEGKTGNAGGLHVHCDLFVDGDRCDPTPYFLDQRSFKIKIKMEESPVKFNISAAFVATANLNIREKSNVKAKLLGLINKGTTFHVDQVVTDTQYIWMHHEKGWSAYGPISGEVTWADPARDSTSELKNTIVLLENKVAEHSHSANLYADRIKKIAALAKV